MSLPLELLAIVIEDFEDRRYTLPDVAPADALRAIIGDRGLQHKDLAAIVGNKGLTTEILAGRRILVEILLQLYEYLRSFFAIFSTNSGMKDFRRFV